MAQLTGTARRPISHAPAFVVGGLLATGILTTGFALALALGVRVELPGQAVAPAVVPDVVRHQPYDGPLDPIEREYIQRATTGRGLAPSLVPTQEVTEHPAAGGFSHELPRPYPAPQ